MHIRIDTVFSAFLLAALAVAGAAAQQPSPADERARAEARQQAAEAAREDAREAQERAEREREAQRDRSDLERELSAARDEMQKAAREVARLSSELAAPFVDGVARGFRFAGQRAMLGVGIEDTERGVRIASVTPNGPAAEAGLKVGDTIIAIEGASLADSRVAGGGKQSPSEILLAQMANVDAGETVELRVLAEGGAERSVKVTSREVWPRVFGDSPFAGPNNPYAFRGPNWFRGGNAWSQMQMIALTPGLGKYFGTDKGLLVVRSPEDADLGLRDGDVILDIGGREPQSAEHAVRILGSFEAGEPLKVTIMRDRRRETIDMKVPAGRGG
jgi:S1-C subfamily serine protease